jgi:hypothetical protein
MKHLFLKVIAVILMLPVSIFAQQKTGVAFGGSKNDRGVHTIKTSDNSLLTVGVTDIPSKGEDVFVVKTDLAGNKVWEKSFGGNKDDAGWDILETDGGKNYLISGWSDSYSEEGDEDILLLKISKQGNLIWSKTLPKNGAERCWSMQQMKSGNFILIGQTQNPVSREMNGLVTKIDSDGNVLAQDIYGDEKYNRLFYCTETATGDLLIAGITRKDSTAENNGWVILIDKTGNQKISNKLTSIKNITTHGVLPISKNEIMVYGYAQTDTAKNQRAIYFSVFDVKGHLKWEKVTNEKDSMNHGIGAIVTSSGSILLTGYSRPLYTGKWNGVVYAFSKKGEMKWKKVFGGAEADQPYGLVEISKNKYLITGLTKSFGNGGEDMWLVWMDENGDVIRQ